MKGEIIMRQKRLSIFIFILALLVLFHFPEAQSAQVIEEYEGVHLEINLDTNILEVYLNNHVMYTFKVATGKVQKDTPIGTFKIVTKVVNPWYLPKNIAGGDSKNPLGTRWIGLNVPDSNGYKYGIHGTNNPSSIGRYVSQGCIRMYNQDVEWLFQHIPKGTLVIIKDERK
jgi:lipoprotein-anchoring transpeptidase ErfK/SrfK